MYSFFFFFFLICFFFFFFCICIYLVFNAVFSFFNGVWSISFDHMLSLLQRPNHQVGKWFSFDQRSLPMRCFPISSFFLFSLLNFLRPSNHHQQQLLLFASFFLLIFINRHLYEPIAAPKNRDLDNR